MPSLKTWCLLLTYKHVKQYSQRVSKAYLELSRAFTQSSFTKMVHGQKPLTNFTIAFKPLFKNVLKSVLQDVLETFFQNVLCGTKQDVFRQLRKMSSRFANLTFLRRLKGILQRCFEGVFYYYLENYLTKMSKNCLFEMFYTPLHEMSFRQL